jgi:hypothetical protein
MTKRGGALALGSPKTTHDAALFRVHVRRRGRATDYVEISPEAGTRGRAGLSAWRATRRVQAPDRAASALAGAGAAVPAAVVTVAPRPAFLARGDRGEIASLARRVSRLTISRHDPEAFHVERDLIYRELLALSRR